MENNDYIKNKNIKLTNDIKNSEEELKELRNMCKHTDSSIENINSKSGSPNLRKVCECCGEVLGIPSNNELIDSGYMTK